MVNNQIFAQDTMEEKTVLEDLLEVKKRVDQMDLVKFKMQWDKHGGDYATLEYPDRLEFTVMSIKILQAKVDLIRTFSSIKECAMHPEPQRATYYYLRSNLWKFLDSFRYVLLIDDINDQVKLDCIDLLNELKEIIAQDEQLKNSCLDRLSKLLAHVKILENDATLTLRKHGIHPPEIYPQIAQRISQLIYALEPQAQTKELPSAAALSPHVQGLLYTYSSFSVSRISIDKSGVLSIIQLLQDYPSSDLEEHKTLLQETLATLEHQNFPGSIVRPLRNQCAYALLILLEMVKMHKGLPVLLLKILMLCAYIHFPPTGAELTRELKGLKGRITNISQKKLRPIIEDVLWKNPEYVANLPYLRTVCPWCYKTFPENTLDLISIQRVVTASFDQLLSIQQMPSTPEDIATSRLSKTVIEILGLLVNLEPSPQFLKLHAQEALQIKQARDMFSPPGSIEKLLDIQYTTYKNHLKFLQDSIEYYQGILEKLGKGAEEK